MSRPLEAVGFVVEQADRRELTWSFNDWMRRMDVPLVEHGRLARLIEEVPAQARATLAPKRLDGSLWHRGWHACIRARKPLH